MLAKVILKNPNPRSYVETPYGKLCQRNRQQLKERKMDASDENNQLSTQFEAKDDKVIPETSTLPVDPEPKSS